MILKRAADVAVGDRLDGGLEVHRVEQVTLPDEGNGLPEREAVFLTFGPSRLRFGSAAPTAPSRSNRKTPPVTRPFSSRTCVRLRYADGGPGPGSGRAAAAERARMDRAQALSLLGLWRRTRPQEGTGWSGTVPLRAISPHALLPGLRGHAVLPPARRSVSTARDG